MKASDEIKKFRSMINLADVLSDPELKKFYEGASWALDCIIPLVKRHEKLNRLKSQIGTSKWLG